MATWLYQFSQKRPAETEGGIPWNPEAYRAEVRERKKPYAWWSGTKLYPLRPGTVPVEKDTIVFYWTPSRGCKQPGVCGLGCVVTYDHPAHRISFHVLPPTDVLKNRPAWNDRVRELVKGIRRGIPTGTMWEVSAEDARTLLHVIGGLSYPLPSSEEIEEADKNAERDANKLSDEVLTRRAEVVSGEVSIRYGTTTHRVRNPHVAVYVKRRAAGMCDLCGSPAPFTTTTGVPYLEVHHIRPLKDGGRDTINNAVALCPNCHRKMHSLGYPADARVLRQASKHRLS